MKIYLLRRFLTMVGMLAALSIIIFLILELPPGDYAERHVYQLKSIGVFVTEEDLINYRHQFGLNKPWPERYFRWITNIVLHGNFGMSLIYRKPVTEVISERIGFTTLIAISAVMFTYGLAIPIGIYSATFQYSAADYFFTFIGYIGIAIPNFLLALILLYISVTVFGTNVGGLFSPEYVNASWSWGRFVDLLRHLWIPAVVIGASGTAFQMRTMRATLLDEKNKLYVTVARAKGLSESRLLLKYPVRVALNPIISTLGWELGHVISGAPIVALVLALPDMGPLFLKALTDEDIYLGGSMLLIYSGLTIIGTFLSDVLLALMDPRIRQGMRV